MYSIGLMSGTSMDGIEAAVLLTDGTPSKIKSIGHGSYPYHALFRLLLKACEYSIKQCEGRLDKLPANLEPFAFDYFRTMLGLDTNESSQLYQEILHYLNICPPIALEHVISHSVQLHEQAVIQLLSKIKLSPANISLIGYHGQAMYHRPKSGKSIILADGQKLANALDIPVITQFRENDIALGGTGAPFAPVYHQALAIRDRYHPCVVVNCGGIANVSIIHSDKQNELIAFDTGPGNALIDQLVRKRTQGNEMMDRNGQFGQNGTLNKAVLAALYDHAILLDGQNYFECPPPKSLDYNDIKLIPEIESLTIEDACRTLAAFTADSIIQSVSRNSHSVPERWIVCGGGWENPIILNELSSRIIKMYPNAKVQKADQIGWPNTAMEAELFAYLAVRSYLSLPLSFPTTTGVNHAVSGGQYYKPGLL